ncbi:unnamed protein product [Mytilus coruscus]|uniref:Uncharacterized protein n=1 Tax=Mytilus coruscus TaxID=42192 RepID=A0A6J8BSZ1_MYTCO|nr:unnamed protein product [Mytilus coruscus]
MTNFWNLRLGLPPLRIGGSCSVKTYRGKTTPGILRITKEDDIQTKVNQSTCKVKQVGFVGLLILNISAVSIYLCCHKHRAKQHQNKTIAGQNDISTTKEEITRIGSSYESINERIICDDIIQMPNSRKREENKRSLTSGSEVYSSRTQNSGYLHPYTTFIEIKGDTLVVHENTFS